MQDALEEFGRGRTVVMIAHRISTIERASKIIVLDAGKVVETGSTEELLQHAGLFARLYALQQGAHARANGPGGYQITSNASPREGHRARRSRD